MKKLIFIMLLLISNKVFAYGEDTILINKNVSFSNNYYLYNLSEMDILESDYFFEGFLIIEIKEPIRIDTVFNSNNEYFLNLDAPIYWVNDLANFENQEKYFYTFLIEKVFNEATLQVQSGIYSKLNSFIYYYKLFNSVNRDISCSYLYTKSERDFSKVIANKYLFRKNNSYYLVFETYFHTAIFNNLINNTKFFIPISHLYNIEYLDEIRAKEYNFEKSDKVIKVK